jgi:hypothetical protein
MTSIKDTKQMLIRKVAEKIQQYGFDPKFREQSFYKKTPFGRLAFHLAFIPHPGIDFDITADIAIRFDSLEDLRNEQKDYLTKAQKKNTFSMGAELGNISEDRQKRWTVARPEDVEPVAQAILDTFASVGIPYLEKYSNMDNALEALSGDDWASSLHSPFDTKRAVSAIGLAFLSGQRERFLQIAEAKTKYLTSRNDSDLKSFLQLKETLEQRFISQDEGKNK